MRQLKLIHHRHIPSTNDWTKEHLHEFDLQQLTCISADQQSAGRGQFGRSWFSPQGNLYLTFCFAIEGYPTWLAHMSQVAAFSVAYLLRTQNIHVHIKWPNDLLMNGHKLGGILTETTPFQHDTAVLVGIGLNVNMVGELTQIDQPATSLRAVTEQMWDIAKLREQLAQRFAFDLELLEDQGFAPFHLPLNAVLTESSRAALQDLETGAPVQLSESPPR